MAQCNVPQSNVLIALAISFGLSGCNLSGGNSYSQAYTQQPSQEILDGTIRNPEDWRDNPRPATRRTAKLKVVAVNRMEGSASSPPPPSFGSEEWFANERRENDRLRSHAQTAKLLTETPRTESPLAVELGSRSNLYASTYENDLTITNSNGFAVRDIEITCDVLTPSGTMVQRFNFKIPGVIPAKGQKIVSSHRFGYWPTQATNINCQGNHTGR